jgi:ribonuclease-3
VELSAVERCQEVIGYTFTRPDLLALALTHSSLATVRLDSNERLEFLGDAVLGLVVCHELYERFDDLLEGQMTKIKSAVVSRHTCAEIAEEAGLADLLLLGKGMPLPSGLPQSVSAAVLESIIGAIYIDGGLAPAREFILSHIGTHIDVAFANEHQRNFKSLLQQHSQRHWNTTPEYQYLDEKGPDHSKCFEVAVSIGGKHFTSAWGMSKKEAEQRAALQALAEMGIVAAEVEDEDFVEDDESDD